MDPTLGSENEKLIWADALEFCSDRVHIGSGHQVVDAFCFPEYSIAHFRYFSTFGDQLSQIRNVEFSFFPKNPDIFLQNVVFLGQELAGVQNCCFRVKELGLSFSEHQKSLKSIDYS